MINPNVTATPICVSAWVEAFTMIAPQPAVTKA
jgi:hypothetical protein